MDEDDAVPLSTSHVIATMEDSLGRREVRGVSQSLQTVVARSRIFLDMLCHFRFALTSSLMKETKRASHAPEYIYVMQNFLNQPAACAPASHGIIGNNWRATRSGHARSRGERGAWPQPRARRMGWGEGKSRTLRSRLGGNLIAGFSVQVRA